MRNAYVTKRLSPPHYIAVTKPLARSLFEAHVPVTLCGSKIDPYHVFYGWYLGYTITPSILEDWQTFDSVVKAYDDGSSHELSDYAVFYIKKEDYERWQKK